MATVRQIQVAGKVYDIEVESIVNKNPQSSQTSKFDWIGTQEEYITQRENGEIPDDWVCFITDDISAENGEIDLTNYVKKTGDETISGKKTFTQQNVYKHTIDTNNPPAEGVWINEVSAQLLDINNIPVGYFYCSQSHANTLSATIGARKVIDGTEKTSDLTVSIDDDGKTYAKAPQTPNEFSFNSTIVTTSYVTFILRTLYPIGSLYIGTQSYCPLTTLIPGSTWELVAQNRSIQGSSDSHAAGTTIEAGLPNIRGQLNNIMAAPPTPPNSNPTWAIYEIAKGGQWSGLTPSRTTNDPNLPLTWHAGFDASKSSSIYKDDITTVQPSAYVTNIWRRTA